MDNIRFTKINVCEKQITYKFHKKKDPTIKEECHTNYKKYTNLLSTLMKKSKQAYYDRYFEKIGKILRPRGKELNPSFLQKL